MIKTKKGLLIVFALLLASCSRSFALFDQSIFFDAFNKDEHYRIVDGEKRNASSHIFDKLVEVGNEEEATNLFGPLSEMPVKVALYSEEEPEKEGCYWHYVNNKPALYGETS